MRNHTTTQPNLGPTNHVSRRPFSHIQTQTQSKHIILASAPALALVLAPAQLFKPFFFFFFLLKLNCLCQFQNTRHHRTRHRFFLSTRSVHSVPRESLHVDFPHWSHVHFIVQLPRGTEQHEKISRVTDTDSRRPGPTPNAAAAPPPTLSVHTSHVDHSCLFQSSLSLSSSFFFFF